MVSFCCVKAFVISVLCGKVFVSFPCGKSFVVSENRLL